MNAVDRFFARATVDEQTGCWVWPTLDRDGYGRHRRAWELARGERLPWPMTIDHLCRNRACVNPEHLEIVLITENIERGMDATPEWRDRLGKANRAKRACPHGHPYDEQNTVLDRTSGARRCRICERAKVARYRAKKAGR